MKKSLGLCICTSLMMSMVSTPVFAEENFIEGEEAKTEFKTNSVQEEPTQEYAISVEVDGQTTHYKSFKEFEKNNEIEGNHIVVQLNQDVDFTNGDIYSKKLHTNGIYLKAKTKGADVTLDLNGHHIVNHYKNPNGNYPARGFTVDMKDGVFKLVNSSKETSHFEVDRLGQLKSVYSTEIIEFIIGEKIQTNTRDLVLQHVVSKYSDFYLGMNGGYKGLQADGTYNFYTSASDAIKDSSDHTAVLVNDYTGGESISADSGTNGVIDLNQKTFTTLDDAIKLMNSDVDLTIKNGNIHAMNEKSDSSIPNVGFIGSSAQDVNNVHLTFDHVDMVSDYWRGIDLHGTDTDLHVKMIDSTLTMQKENSYGIYMPAKDSSVTLERSTIKAGTGIAVKGGTLNVIDSKIIANGKEYIPDTGMQSGFEETGDAIYVDGTYKYPIEVHVKNSEVTSQNAKAVRELFVDETLNNVDVVAESGRFSSDVMRYVPEDKASIKADSYYYVGTEEEVLEEAKNAQSSVEIIQGIDSIQVPEGVEVTNKTGHDVNVNGDVVKDGQTITADKIPSQGGGGGSVATVDPVYRAYNPNSGEHLYTLDEKELKHVTSVGWNDEGIAFMAETAKNGQALYRVYNPNSGLHHYTLDVNEKNTLISLGWDDEGIAWYTSKKPMHHAVYRLYNPNDGQHHYTIDQHEKDVLDAIGWNFEGIAFRSAPISK